MIETAPGPEDVSPQALPTDPEALRVLVREVIVDYISHDNPDAAQRLKDQVEG